MILNVLFVLVGFVLLVKGGDFLIDGAVAIARRAKLSAMVIGLTVVGFGTSTPELLVSAHAAWVGSSGIAIGNVAGSNIANIALILGMTALICPLPSKRDMMRIDMPFMLLSMVCFVAAAYQGVIARWMGLVMVAMLVVFVGWEVRKSRKEEKRKEREKAERAATASLQSGPEDGMEAATVLQHGGPVGEEEEKPVMALWKALLLVVVSIGAMVWGSNLLVKGASGIAMELGEMLGVSAQEMERIIGLTVVAVGTSLPELFASVIAARKGETDMAVGNIIGSVTFNILCVIGVSSAITPIRDAWSGWAMDYGLMVLLGALLWFFLWTKHRLERWEGAVLLAMYVAFLGKTMMI